MAQFNTSEIDDAKKRVREMQERTKSLGDSKQSGEINFEALKVMIEMLSPLKEGDLNPLALFAIISSTKGECDKTLLLAIIYILL